MTTTERHDPDSDRTSQQELRTTPSVPDALGEPIAPSWLRNVEEFRAVAGLVARRASYRTRKHLFLSPRYVFLLALYVPRGAARLVAALARYLYDNDSAAMRHEHADNRESPEYRGTHSVRRANLKARWMVATSLAVPVLFPVLAWTAPRLLASMVSVLLFVWIVKIIPGREFWELVVAAGIAGAVWWWLPGRLARLPEPPWWVWLILLTAALLGLGWHGRPTGKSLLAQVHLADAGVPQKPTKEMVIDALCRSGIPGMTLQQADRVHDETRVIAPGVATSAHGYTIEMELPPGITAEMVVAKRAPLAGALRRDLACVWPNGNPNRHPGYLRIFLSHKPMNSGKQPAWPLAVGKPIDIFDPMELFTDEENRWVKLTLAGTHAAVGGASGFGKSVWLRQLACAIAFDPRVRLIVFDGKRSGDLDCIRRLAHGFYEGAEAEDVDEQLGALRGLVKERERRAKFLSQLPRDERSPKVTTALASKYKGLSPIVLLCDEVQEYTEYGIKGQKEDMKIREEFVGLLTKLSRVGRAAGIICIFCSQKPDATVLPSAIMGNCSIRVAFKVSEQVHNDQILGTSARKNGVDATMFGARDRGMAWLRGGDDVDAQVVRSWSKMTDVGLADELAEKAFLLRQSRGMLTGQAAGETPDGDEIAVDVIADALTVVEAPGHAGRNISLRMLAVKLRDLRPTTWSQLDEKALGALLRTKNVTVDAIHCPAEGRTMQGVKREWLVAGDDTEGGS